MSVEAAKAPENEDAQKARIFVTCELEVNRARKELEEAKARLEKQEIQLQQARTRLMKIDPLPRVFVLQDQCVMVHVLAPTEGDVVGGVVCSTFEEA